MRSINIKENDTGSLKVLCLGAHCDDIEIGCGGAILEITKKIKDVSVYWHVFSSNEQRKAEAQASAEQFLVDAKSKKVKISSFRDGFLPDHWKEIKEVFESIKKEINPDIVFTHYRNDLHQDHRVISELTWNTFRNHLILEYEILKFDGDIGNPNIYVPVSDDSTSAKISIILSNFKTQASKHWFTDETFRSFMRVRGVEASEETVYAEAFYSRKASLTFGS